MTTGKPFNTSLADQLSKLVSNTAELPSAKARCQCHHKFLDQCPTLWMRDAQHRPGPIDKRTGAERVADVRAERAIKLIKKEKA